MKNKILLLLHLILAYRVSAQHSRKPKTYEPFMTYRQYLTRVYYDRFTVDNGPNHDDTYYYPGKYFKINTDSLLTDFAPALLEDSIEIKYASHRYSSGSTSGNSTVAVGIRFKKRNFWIPLCDSTLILKYLRANDSVAAKCYLNFYIEQDKRIYIGGSVGAVALVVWAKLQFAPVAAPVLAPLIVGGALYSTFYCLRNKKIHGTYASNSTGIVSHYNTTVANRIANKN